MIESGFNSRRNGVKTNLDDCTVTSVVLDGMSLHPLMFAELERCTKAFKEKAPNILRRPDYIRWSSVLQLLPQSGSVLDVGVGVGQFVHALQSSGYYDRVEGLDIKPHTHYLPMPIDPVEITYCSATSMPFSDNEFEIVTCLEVIEHLETEDMHQVISELRRVASKELIITVPYCEKEPLPSYHKQRYDLPRIKELFPNAQTILMANADRVPWVLVRENFQ